MPNWIPVVTLQVLKLAMTNSLQLISFRMNFMVIGITVLLRVEEKHNHFILASRLRETTNSCTELLSHYMLSVTQFQSNRVILHQIAISAVAIYIEKRDRGLTRIPQRYNRL